MSKIIDSLLLTHIIKDFQSGNTEKAFIRMMEYIKTFPKDSTAKYNYAIMADRMGDTELAIKNYTFVMKANSSHWQSRNNMYLYLFKNERYAEALKLINEVLIIKPNYQPVLRDKAHVYIYLKKLDLALKFIDQSIKLNPNDYIAINILGMIYNGLREYAKAKKIFIHAINLNGEYYPSYSNLAKCLTELNERSEAITYLKKCLSIKPDFLEANNNLANVYSTEGNYEEAIPLYLKILEKEEGNFKVNLNLAIAYFNRKDFFNAKKYFEIANTIDSQSDELRKNYGIYFLYKQDYKKAWEMADGRLKLQSFYLPDAWINNFKNKLWDGEKINLSSKILVIKEQGVGDEILYSSIYPDLLNKFPHVKIESETRLLDLFKKSYANKNAFIPYLSISESKEKLKEFEFVIMAGTLGRLFRNSIDDFPESNCLTASTQMEKEILIKLNKISNKKKIGISWKSKREFLGEGKSLSLESLSPLLCNSNFEFINLQYGDVEEEIIAFYKKYNKKIHTISNVDLFNDFEKIIALMKQLDLFISVSNSTAHLAGAANIKTCLIKPKSHALFHYWNQPTNSTPWYPSIKIIDQQKDPSVLIDRLKEELMYLI
jgi:tetratricopeptide (TPR) repeat protein